jgi:hypothetical protein
LEVYRRKDVSKRTTPLQSPGAPHPPALSAKLWLLLLLLLLAAAAAAAACLLAAAAAACLLLLLLLLLAAAATTTTGATADADNSISMMPATMLLPHPLGFLPSCCSKPSNAVPYSSHLRLRMPAPTTSAARRCARSRLLALRLKPRSRHPHTRRWYNLRRIPSAQYSNFQTLC